MEEPLADLRSVGLQMTSSLWLRFFLVVWMVSQISSKSGKKNFSKRMNVFPSQTRALGKSLRWSGRGPENRTSSQRMWTGWPLPSR